MFFAPMMPADCLRDILCYNSNYPKFEFERLRL